MNNNEHDALFIFSLLHYHSSTCFGRLTSLLSGGRMCICGKWYWLYCWVDCQQADWQLTCSGVIAQLTEDKRCTGLVTIHIIQAAWSTQHKKDLGLYVFSILIYYLECLRIVGNLPRRTPIPLLHATFSMPPIRDLIHNMTARCFDASSSHTNPLIQAIGNYTLRDLHLQYKNYIHKRTKHILL
jgi:hypothetical protein